MPWAGGSVGWPHTTGCGLMVGSVPVGYEQHLLPLQPGSSGGVIALDVCWEEVEGEPGLIFGVLCVSSRSLRHGDGSG